MQRYLDGGEGGNDGWTAESVRDEREVRQVTLNVRFQDDLRPRVAQRRSVLVEQVHQLFGDLPRRTREKRACLACLSRDSHTERIKCTKFPPTANTSRRAKGSRYLMRLLVLFDTAVMYYYNSSRGFLFFS